MSFTGRSICSNSKTQLICIFHGMQVLLKSEKKSYKHLLNVSNSHAKVFREGVLTVLSLSILLVLLPLTTHRAFLP
jgi:hypothetical protein